MQKRNPKTPPKRNEENDGSMFPLMLLLGAVVGIPLILIILLAVTPLRDVAQSAMGNAIKQDDNFIIYDATCRADRNISTLIVTYWTADPAPIGYEYDGKWYQIANLPQGGIYTANIALRNTSTCPDFVTLSDISRDRQAKALIEVIES